MTTEEAILRLQEARKYPVAYTPEEQEAYEMAFSALRAQQTADDAIEGLCCDCAHGGPCCDYNENEGCEHHRADGSCWIARSIAKLDRSRWEGCEWCQDKVLFDEQDMEIELQHPLEDEPRMVYPKYCPMCGRPLTEDVWAELERRIGGNDGTTD